MKQIIQPGLSEVLFWGLSESTGLRHDFLFPIEAVLVEKIFEMTDKSLSLQLRKQFDFYNKFWRGGEWRTFEMRRVRWGEVCFPDELRIQVDKDDVRIASIQFTTSECSIPNWAVYHLVNGRFFCIEFGTSYKKIRFSNTIEVLAFKPNRELAQMVSQQNNPKLI